MGSMALKEPLENPLEAMAYMGHMGLHRARNWSLDWETPGNGAHV